MVEFGTGNLSDKVLRENFIGEVVASEYPCKCEYCAKGDEKLVEAGGQGRDSLHMLITPFSEYSLDQHIYLDPSAKTKWSRWGAFNIALEKAGISIKSEKDFVGRAFEFEFVPDFVEYVQSRIEMTVPASITKAIAGKRTDCWIIAREVSGDELEKYKEMAGKEAEENVVV